MAIRWTPLDDKRDVLFCTGCGGEQFTVRSEPVRRKRHNRNGHKRRVVAVCKRCKRSRTLKYGGARGRQRGRERAARNT